MGFFWGNMGKVGMEGFLRLYRPCNGRFSIRFINNCQGTMAIQGQTLCILMTVTCGLSYLLYGYDQGFMSGVLYDQYAFLLCCFR